MTNVCKWEWDATRIESHPLPSKHFGRYTVVLFSYSDKFKSSLTATAYSKYWLLISKLINKLKLE